LSKSALRLAALSVDPALVLIAAITSGQNGHAIDLDAVLNGMSKVREGQGHEGRVWRFPISVFYSIEGHEIVVHSVFDNRQDPAKRP